MILSVKFRVSINKNSKGKDQQAGQKRQRVLSASKLDSLQSIFETIGTIDLLQYTDLLIYLPEGAGCFLCGCMVQAPSCRTRRLMDTLPWLCNIVLSQSKIDPVSSPIKDNDNALHISLDPFAECTKLYSHEIHGYRRHATRRRPNALQIS